MQQNVASIADVVVGRGVFAPRAQRRVISFSLHQEAASCSLQKDNW
jgi:hypothetical protein